MVKELCETLGSERAGGGKLAQLLKLAQQTGFTRGKWIMFAKASPSEIKVLCGGKLKKHKFLVAGIDEIWGQVARHTHAGRLGSKAMVTTSRTTRASGRHGSQYGEQYMITVWTSDFSDTEELTRLANILVRECGALLQCFKPDILTFVESLTCPTASAKFGLNQKIDLNQLNFGRVGSFQTIASNANKGDKLTNGSSAQQARKIQRTRERKEPIAEAAAVKAAAEDDVVAAAVAGCAAAAHEERRQQQSQQRPESRRKRMKRERREAKDCTLHTRPAAQSSLESGPEPRWQHICMVHGACGACGACGVCSRWWCHP
jgi:hypothetical protein